MGFNIAGVITEMIQYFGTDIRRINHFMKVYAFSKAIGESEGLTAEALWILEVSAVMHDIGIKVSEQKYNSAAGGYQQLEGPPVAREMLNRLGYPENVIDRVCYIIAHHHTYDGIDGMDYQILVEADFLINFYEGNVRASTLPDVREKIFKTSTGLRYLDIMYKDFAEE